MSSHDIHTFSAMGTDVSLWIDHPDRAFRREQYARAEHDIAALAGRLTRFDPASELARVNARAGSRTSVTKEFADWLAAALWAAEWTGGIVDPTLAGQLTDVGYGESLSANPAAGGRLQVALADALRSPHLLSTARPMAPARWRGIELDRDREGARATVSLPEGVLLDSGGTGKGFITDRVFDAVSARLAPDTRWWIDSGGDVRLSYLPLSAAAHAVDVAHPLTGERTHRVAVWGGAVATSSIARRVWRNADGTLAHHLLDPRIGRPVWSGLISATAIGSSTLQAETLAKWSLLTGPDSARKLLHSRGGLIVHESGETEIVGAARPSAIGGVRVTGTRCKEAKEAA